MCSTDLRCGYSQVRIPGFRLGLSILNNSVKNNASHTYTDAWVLVTPDEVKNGAHRTLVLCAFCVIFQSYYSVFFLDFCD